GSTMGVSCRRYLGLALWSATTFIPMVAALKDQEGNFSSNRVARQINFGGQSQGFQGQTTPSCQFPFIYIGVTHTTCTTVNDPEGKLWCSTKTDSQNNHVPGGNFKHCTSADLAPQAPSAPSCRFPFIYNGVMHTTCITDNDPEGKLWCSTKTDNQNNHILDGGHFKHCTSANQG
ncbi:unnamed protein product, partial [Meganyctiphanes norvegica]